MRITSLRAVAALACLPYVAACGGSSDGTPLTRALPPAAGQFPANPQIPPGPGDAAFSAISGTAPASAYGAAGAGAPTRAQATITIDFATGAVSGAGFDGTLSGDRSRIVLSDGGEVRLSNAGGHDYMRFYARSPRSGISDAGVIGFPTGVGAMPGGSASYFGRAEVLATDETRIYTLTGMAIVDADFAGGTVTVRLTTLGGTAQGLSGSGIGLSQVPNAGEVSVSGAALSGATFAGGTPSLIATPFAGEGALRDAGTAGSFFGPGADEVGGQVAIDGAGALRVRGRFAAD